MSERKIRDWIADIQSAMVAIKEDIGEMSEEQFLDDAKTIRAVIKSMTDIGEGAKEIMTLLPRLQVEQPDVWKHLTGIYAMRIKLTHRYFGTDAGVVWSTSQKSLPEFESLLSQISDEYGDDDGKGKGGATDRPVG